ncbi:MAG TPA: glycosyltransferase family 39 protein, partial [Phototrophicaceae bacterium]|nr:glycosyltransferase family 39 protein [Phototrophicaceae bacterium]
MPFPRLTLRYRDFLIALAILLLAFGLRTVVLSDRAHNDPQFLPLPTGSDQHTYVTSAEAYEAGTFPNAPFRYQPGFIYFLVGVRKLVGTNLIVDRLALVLTDSLACGLMIGVGWLLTKRRWGGFLTGLLYAFYPVAIFYSTEFLLEGLALFYVCLFLFLTLWQRERRSLVRSALIGVVLGLTTITRSNLALLLIAWLLWLWLIEPQRRQMIAHGAISLIALALMIAPVTLWNIKAGSVQLVTNVGVDEIYRADSRDSDGTYLNPYNAHLTVDQGYAQALIDDLKHDPLHFVAIQVRKLGLYWSNAEPANNIDYYQDGIEVSALLRAIPLDFRILAALG